MTDNVCYSILKTATQQIIQSAGFEGANAQSINTLADVFGNYIQLLGSTVSAYANLNGRTMGNMRDMMYALDEISVDHVVLKHWLEEEGKALTPWWSAQSDPSRLLQGIVNDGKPNYKDAIEYRFGHVEEYDILSPPSSPLLESPTLPAQIDNETKALLPDYVPSFFPPFPEIKDENEEDADNAAVQQQLLLQQEKAQQKQQLQKNADLESLPLPVIVKNRKKPIENPFTHIIPFEDSGLATENDTNQEDQPLSLVSKESVAPTESIDLKRKPDYDMDESGEEELLALKKRKASTNSLMDALLTIKSKPDGRLGEGLAGQEELFLSQTQDAAAPGNYMFNHDGSVFDEIVRFAAEPLVISKIMAPNLLTDMAISGSSSTPATPSAIASNVNVNSLFALDRGVSPGSLPASPDSYSSKMRPSGSMLAALASGTGGPSKNGFKKMGRLPKSGATSMHLTGSSSSTPISLNALSSHVNSKHSVDINVIKTEPSKYIIKKNKMLAEKQKQDEKKQFLEQQQKEHPELAQQLEQQHIQQLKDEQEQHIRRRQQEKQERLLEKQKEKEREKLANSQKKKAGLNNNKPKLTLNFSNHQPFSQSLSSAGGDDSATSSPSTPKIRFKLKPPEQSPITTPTNTTTLQSKTIKISMSSPSSSSSLPLQKPTTQYDIPIKLERQQLPQPQQVIPPSPSTPLSRQPPPPPQSLNSYFSTMASSSSATSYSTDEINCICENPTVDYGTFMIACDNCGVWFHGSCVGIAESDQVDEWYCRRCSS